MKYIIEDELMKQLVNYLVSRPYAEVFMLLDQVRNVKGLSEDPTPPPAAEAAQEVPKEEKTA